MTPPPSAQFIKGFEDDNFDNEPALSVDDDDRLDELLGELKSRLGKVAVASFVFDPRVQRANVNKTKINNMVANFYKPALGTTVVSERANGTNVCLDGMHRVKVCELVPEAPRFLDARIFEDLTIRQEAKLFRLYNNRTAMHSVDLFNAETTEGSERALRIVDIVEHYGAKVATDSFSAVKTALRIVERPDGFERFSEALEVISDSWTTMDKTSLDGRIVEGLTVFLEYYGDLDVTLDIKHLKRNLKDLGSDGAIQIMKLAVPYKQARGGRVPWAVCEVLVSKYNKGLTSARKLPDFQRK